MVGLISEVIKKRNYRSFGNYFHQSIVFMNWYLAKIVYQIICGNGQHTPQFDEQLRLINAESKEDAFQKANYLGKSEEEIFFNNNEQLVHWLFINVAELLLIGELKDGAELYSHIEEKENADAYILTTHQKASNILSDKFPETIELI